MLIEPVLPVHVEPVLLVLVEPVLPVLVEPVLPVLVEPVLHSKLPVTCQGCLVCEVSQLNSQLLHLNIFYN